MVPPSVFHAHRRITPPGEFPGVMYHIALGFVDVQPITAPVQENQHRAARGIVSFGRVQIEALFFTEAAIVRRSPVDDVAR